MLRNWRHSLVLAQRHSGRRREIYCGSWEFPEPGRAWALLEALLVAFMMPFARLFLREVNSPGLGRSLHISGSEQSAFVLLGAQPCLLPLVPPQPRYY